MTNDRITGPCPECERTRAENARLRVALVNIGQARIVNSTELQRIARAALEVKK